MNWLNSSGSSNLSRPCTQWLSSLPCRNWDASLSNNSEIDLADQKYTSANQDQVFFSRSSHRCFQCLVHFGVCGTRQPAFTGNSLKNRCIHCPRDLGLCEIVAGMFRQQFHHLVYLFVFHHSDHYVQVLKVGELELGCDLFYTVDIMS